MVQALEVLISVVADYTSVKYKMLQSFWSNSDCCFC